MDSCHEIVFFQFTPGTSLPQQRAHMESMMAWVRRQPGFVSRACFHDAGRDAWVDHVVWTDEASAKAAFASIGAASELAAAMQAIAPEGMVAGHYVELL